MAERLTTKGYLYPREIRRFQVRPLGGSLYFFPSHMPYILVGKLTAWLHLYFAGERSWGVGCRQSVPLFTLFATLPGLLLVDPLLSSSGLIVFYNPS
jgi:hypothetical protein